MPTQHGIRLAVHIIDSHFGPLVSKVCECLLLKESVTLNQIVNHTGLSKSDVKKCILVLIQHNCVQPFNLEQRGGFNEGNSVSTQYTALYSNILHRLRFAKFLDVVTKKLGKECAEVLHGLLEHGRRTLEQIIKRAESTQSEAPQAAHDAFRRLASARFVERCPDSDPFIDLPTDEETTAKNRRSKFSKVIPRTIEQRAIAAAIPMEAKRFLISYDNTPDDTTVTEKDAPSILSSGEKRKRDFSEVDEELGAARFQKEVLWRPNFEEFIRCLRHKACIVHERSRFDEKAAVVLSAMLEGSRNLEGSVISTHSVPLSLNAIYEEVMKTETGRTMTLDHVRSSLDELGCKDAKDLYSVDLDNIVRLCQNEEVKSFVKKRYGSIAYKIFKFLSMESCFVKTDKIISKLTEEKVETHSNLFSMWKDNLLSMEKFSTPAAPRSTNCLLWKINKKVVWKQVLDGMLQAALNLMIRASFELNKESELMELPKSKITGVLATKRARLNNIRGCLEVSLMRLDDAIMLLQDFLEDE
ncbi:hypothetical protein QQ045_008503 [Rhodiola kirilowii]